MGARCGDAPSYSGRKSGGAIRIPEGGVKGRAGCESVAFDLVVLFEHPEWQKPLWAALERRGVRYAALDHKRAAFDPDAVPGAALYFNQASPSAYVRGNTRAAPLALSLMRSLELGGARVLNGSRAFLL